MNRPGEGYYESRSVVDEYLAFHYPAEDFLAALLGPGLPPPERRFPLCVRRLWRGPRDGPALDVGAACGRVTFDLARDHTYAWGLDRSQALIAAANEVLRTGRARYRTVLEGDLTAEHDVRVATVSNTCFLVGDAQRLPFPSQHFATVVALNLLDRVPDPGHALDELARVVAPEGVLIVSSPYTWLEQFTPRERWLGGFRRDDSDVRGYDSVRDRLADAFSVEEEERRPFFIPHHARSGQLGVAHIQKFRRTT